MPHDDRNENRPRGRGDWRGEDAPRGERGWGRETQWSGDPSFGTGWGNQTARPQRLGDRDDRRPVDDPYAEAERFDRNLRDRYYAGGPDLRYGPGLDAGFGGPRFDRADVGSIGSHGAHPVASVSGGSYGFGGEFGNSAREFAIQRHDPHYAEWRTRQIAALDRDYEEYRREHQSRFDDEFGGWRERRGQQRAAIAEVREDMEVVGSDDARVGTVDRVQGERILLNRKDEKAGGIHHSIPCSWIDHVGDKVKLNITADEALRRWRTEGRSRALFEREDSGSPGPRMLNRSFSGTYPDE